MLFNCWHCYLLKMNFQQFQQSKHEVSTFAAISQAFINLGDLSAQVYDYWISELYTEDGDLDWSKWNEDTLRLMELDVFILSESQ
jgi:TPP-dependent trihydroxycyclohexane-1,2-dione (THcHDO) dehydratase